MSTLNGPLVTLVMSVAHVAVGSLEAGPQTPTSKWSSAAGIWGFPWRTAVLGGGYLGRGVSL